MLYEYKIQKVVNGNNEESFKIISHKVSSKKWCKRKQWEQLDRRGPDRYGVKDFYDTLGEAQNIVKSQMEADAEDEYSQNRHKITVMKEFSYVEIPKYVPVEQQEKFCDLEGVKNAI